MVSRTTDDYMAMVTAGCKAVCEPAFWAGYDRSSVNGFYDYFRQLTDYEPKRAAKFGLPHFSWLCINPKEAEDLVLGREVIAMIPDFLDRENVLGIGEIGLNKNSRNELIILEEHMNLAAEKNQLILVHTPHLEDKLKGTKLIVDLIKNDSRIDPNKVLIDHVEEHTVKIVMDAGMWGGLTLYPESKCTSPRAIDILENYGADRLWMNSSCDWGVSVPLAVPYAAYEMRRRGYDDETVDQVFFKNPIKFLSQCANFTVRG